MDHIVFIYLIYTAVSIGLTVWLARTLYRNGAVFLSDVFEDRPYLADATNRLLVVGFYMLNLGYAFLILRRPDAASASEAVHFLIERLGLLLVSLGVIHFVNMLVFWNIRKRVALESAPLPVHPQAVLPQPADGDPFPA